MSEKPNPTPDPVAPAAGRKSEPKEPAAEQPSLVSIDEFARIDLRTARVLEAQPHPDADRLVVLTVDLGSEQRTLVAGIKRYREPESLVGKTIIVVANLRPARLRGVESRGMLLAVDAGDDFALLTPDQDMPPGIRVH